MCVSIYRIKAVKSPTQTNLTLRFIKEVQRQDMALILRVGPYICAEKSFGGLPAWLLTIPDMEVLNALFEKYPISKMFLKRNLSGPA